jgi:hypothetical protein
MAERGREGRKEGVRGVIRSQDKIPRCIFFSHTIKDFEDRGCEFDSSYSIGWVGSPIHHIGTYLDDGVGKSSTMDISAHTF